MGRVNGKIVIVTGAAGGMGSKFAERLVAEGASVMLTDVLAEEGQAVAATLGERAHFMVHDVRNEHRWQQVIEETERMFGPVSVLVNNAGVFSGGPTEEVELDEYRRILDINQVSVFLGIKTVVPSMRRANGGSIVNISSAAGLIGSPYSLAYTASKFAVRGMTKAAAVEYAADNIRVNSIHPGLVDTPMAKESAPDEETLQAILAAIPLGRLGRPDDITGMVLYLASDESSFATGAEFVLDGGFVCH